MKDFIISEIPFINLQWILKVKVCFILSNWNFVLGTCTRRTKAKSATSFHCWISKRSGKFLNWLVTQKPLHQTALTGISIKASREYGQPGSTPGSLLRKTGVSCSHSHRLRPAGDRPTCIWDHLVLFVCSQPHRHKNPLEFFFFKRFCH